jgi:preprotein translocase subunit SecY
MSAANTATLIQSWFYPELRKKLNFLLFALAIFVVGTHIPAPGMDLSLVQSFFDSSKGGGIFDIVDLFSGGAFKRFSIFALGIMPYINASIMFQLAVAIMPELKQIQQEGEEGRKKISRWTRYLAIALAFFQGSGFITAIFQDSGQKLLSFDGMTALMAVVGGTCFLMWLGDEISQKGIGNGASMIIMIGIVEQIPTTIWQELRQSHFEQTRIMALILIGLLTVAVVAAVVFIQLSQRKIPVQYARRQIGKRTYGGQSTYLPIKVTHAGVIPIIFAISVMMVPSTVLGFMPHLTEANRVWALIERSAWNPILQFLLVFMFTFVYTAVTFQTQDIADNLKKNNGFIPGIRPGKPTYDFLDKVLHRVTFMGAMFLGAIAILPSIVNGIVQAFTNVTMSSIYLGGTSLLIVVGVALDTVQQMQAHMIMRHYSGFNK